MVRSIISESLNPRGSKRAPAGRVGRDELRGRSSAFSAFAFGFFGLAGALPPTPAGRQDACPQFHTALPRGCGGGGGGGVTVGPQWPVELGAAWSGSWPGRSDPHRAVDSASRGRDRDVTATFDLVAEVLDPTGNGCN